MPQTVRRLQQEVLNEFAETMRDRRSIDFFEAEPPEPGILLEAIELARWAPNHRLTEPWKFYRIGEKTAAELAAFGAAVDTARKGERAGVARFARLQAIPASFVVTCKTNEDELKLREDYAACCCAIQNLTLYLWALGIGVKWTTGAMTREPGFCEILEIDPASEFVVGYFWYGRPRIVPEQKRRDVNDIVVERP